MSAFDGNDGASKSPALLRPPPKRGIGVRRLNKKPVMIAAGVGALIAGTIGYTMEERAAHHGSGVSDKKVEAATPEIVVPPNSVVAASGPTHPAHAYKPKLPAAPSDGTPSEDADNGLQKFRKQAWETYYKRLAELDKQRYTGFTSAMQAEVTTGVGGSGLSGIGGDVGNAVSSGAGSVGQSVASLPSEGSGGVGPIGAPGLGPIGVPGGRFGGGGYGGFAGGYGGYGGGYGGYGGYGGGRPVLPDTTGAREKQAFVGQAGSDGDEAKDTLQTTLRPPSSPYLITVGDVIPCIMQGGANSDTPGQLVGRVETDVYDSATGLYKLIPKDSKVVGVYDNTVSSGQTRLTAVLKYIVFPDSSQIDIGAMAAADEGGYAGLHDIVNEHLWAKLGNALILTAAAAAAQLSQGNANSNGYNSQQIIAGSMGQQFGELGQEFARSGLTQPNTVIIRPGDRFVIQVSKNMVFPGPYVDMRTHPTQSVSYGPIMK